MRHRLSGYMWPLIIAAVVVLVRVVYLLQVSQDPTFAVPMVDEKWHWEWAHEILGGPFWGDGAWFRAPLYPYFLALLAWITHSSIFWAKLLQSLLAVGTALLVFRLAEYLFNRTTAVVAGLAYALYGTLVFYETMFLIPVLFLFLCVWGMYRVVVYRESDRALTWLGTGVVFGLAAIARPNVLLVIPFLALWLFLIRRPQGSVLARLRLPVVLAIGVILAIAPVTIRNAVVTGEFMLVSSQGGINLYLGNNGDADGLTMAMPEVNLDESVSWRRFGAVTRAAAEREAGRTLSDAEESSFWTGKALRFMYEHPGQFAGLLWRKLLYLVSGFENSDNVDIYYQRERSSLLGALVWHVGVYFPFGLLLPLMILGVYLLRSRARELAPLYIFLLAYTPSILLFLVTARHRLPLVPFMLILASAGVIELGRNWRRLPIKRTAMAIGLVILHVFIFNRTFYDQADEGGFQWHLHAGIALEQMGDFEGAEREYLLAHDAFPHSPVLLNNLGWVQYRQGQHSEADFNFHQALRADPGYAPAYNNLGLLAMEQAELDSARVLFATAIRYYGATTPDPTDVAQTHLNLARVFERLGLPDSAAAAYGDAVGVAPDWARAYFRAGAFFARHNEHEAADSLFARGAQIEAPSAGDYFNWGLSLLARERRVEGADMMMQAIQRDSSLYQAYYCVAAAFQELGMPRDSVNAYVERCLSRKPDYQPALELFERVNAPGQ